MHKTTSCICATLFISAINRHHENNTTAGFFNHKYPNKMQLFTRQRNYLHTALWLIGLTIFLLSLAHLVQADANDGRDSAQGTAVSAYPSNWLIQMLKVLLDDMDWKSLSDATAQVEKFIRAADRMISAFRSNKQQSANSDRQDSSPALDFKKLFSSSSSNSRWWTSSSASKNMGAADAADSSSVRGMLERIACFVGYMRLLNHSNEALAELDAAKVVSNLFAADKRNSSGFFSNLFG